MKTEHNLKFLEDATETLRAVAHPVRLLIIGMLHEKGSLSVTEIHEALGVEQAVASHHLRILKDKSVLSVRRDGKNSYYSLSKIEFFQIVALLEKAI